MRKQLSRVAATGAAFLGLVVGMPVSAAPFSPVIATTLAGAADALVGVGYRPWSDHPDHKVSSRYYAASHYGYKSSYSYYGCHPSCIRPFRGAYPYCRTRTCCAGDLFLLFDPRRYD